mgnify:CR=1 FL=1
MTHSRREENLDEGNNNGLEKVVKYLEKIYTKKDHPGNSPSLEVSLRYCKLLNKSEKAICMFFAICSSGNLESHVQTFGPLPP